MCMYLKIKRIPSYYQKIVIALFFQKNTRKMDLIKIENILFARC